MDQDQSRFYEDARPLLRLLHGSKLTHACAALIAGALFPGQAENISSLPLPRLVVDL
jgi:hypothetical protein